MIKILCSIFIKKTSNSLIFSMIKYPPPHDAERGFFHSLKLCCKGTINFSNIQIFA